MRADLHVHSTASDGTLSPSQLVSLALERRIDVLAIADHDSVEGLAEATAAASGTSLTLIPALELSSTDGERDVHILGYFIDPTDRGLLDHLAELRAARRRRAERMVEALSASGIDVSIEDVLKLADGGAVGRSHVARAVVRAGHADTVSDAFERLIGRKRPFYVAKESRTPAQAISTIRDAGGLAVVAHPGVNRADDLLPAMIQAGLAGLEAYHADHTPQQREHYAAMAVRHRLLCTGGSDFHGPEAPNPGLGDVDLPASCVQRLLEAGAGR